MSIQQQTPVALIGFERITLPLSRIEDAKPSNQTCAFKFDSLYSMVSVTTNSKNPLVAF